VKPFARIGGTSGGPEEGPLTLIGDWWGYMSQN
jgi:hypothetical protein